MFDIVHIQLTEDMKTHVDVIDRQHQHMLDMASTLINSIGEREETRMTHDSLVFLVEYTKTHFADEEALQIKSEYPGYERHREIHRNFMAVAEALQQRFQIIDDPDFLYRELQNTVISWVTEHILTEDTVFARHYRRYLQKEPADAKE